MYRGKTPVKTLASALHHDRKRADQSLFVKSSDGLYALRKDEIFLKKEVNNNNNHKAALSPTNLSKKAKKKKS